MSLYIAPETELLPSSCMLSRVLLGVTQALVRPKSCLANSPELTSVSLEAKDTVLLCLFSAYSILDIQYMLYTPDFPPTLPYTMIHTYPDQ